VFPIRNFVCLDHPPCELPSRSGDKQGTFSSVAYGSEVRFADSPSMADFGTPHETIFNLNVQVRNGLTLCSIA
jgi:hypothetical protein